METKASALWIVSTGAKYAPELPVLPLSSRPSILNMALSTYTLHLLCPITTSKFSQLFINGIYWNCFLIARIFKTLASLFTSFFMCRLPVWKKLKMKQQKKNLNMLILKLNSFWLHFKFQLSLNLIKNNIGGPLGL